IADDQTTDSHDKHGGPVMATDPPHDARAVGCGAVGSSACYCVPGSVRLMDVGCGPGVIIDATRSLRPVLDSGSRSTRTSGSHASQRGKYQFQSPSSSILAGTSTRRMSVASMRMATASPKPTC